VKIYVVTRSYVEDEDFVAFLDEANARRYAEREGNPRLGRSYELLEPVEVLDAPSEDIVVVP
jgi:hypothetical protein